MNYDNLNLKELTVFDLCSDKEYLDRHYPWGKEEYLNEVRLHPDLRWEGMLCLAEESGYEGLEAAVEQQFAEEISHSFDE
ncbi:MAG TPA: hypothetical protein H9816_04650 [Candidatus Tidjanibacter faecipullorum]|uniref:Uncharacterized protein n=1 Tax=Candidatus Tidjanibacter faecipullorum TaxID=2838766 RepID=A0A9D2ILW0_9BACT|nr:hypothetical protein [Candidatus Tidjanibacter faecipullorum]